VIAEARDIKNARISATGNKERRASGWVSDADRLVKMMTKIDCEAGETRIERFCLTRSQKPSSLWSTLSY
jgi:hypothetical protein